MHLAEQKCTPCAGGIPPMSVEDAHNKMKDLPGWELIDNGRRIQRMFKFHDFAATWRFVDRIAQKAENEGHHPDICFGWGYCTVSYQTHDINGLHENDFIMAAKVNEISHDEVFASELR